jgi:hypothetical protein
MGTVTEDVGWVVSETVKLVAMPPSVVGPRGGETINPGASLSRLTSHTSLPRRPA